MMDWLAQGVPIALLMDLAAHGEFDSSEILHTENGPDAYAAPGDGAGWLVGAAAR